MKTSLTNIPLVFEKQPKRLGRVEYFLQLMKYLLMNVPVLFLYFVLDRFVLSTMTDSALLKFMFYGLQIATVIIMTLLFLSAIRVTIARLHDLNLHGAWVILLFLPVVNVVSLLLPFIPGSKASNKYGQAPASPAKWKVYLACILLLIFIILPIASVYLNGSETVCFK